MFSLFTSYTLQHQICLSWYLARFLNQMKNAILWVQHYLIHQLTTKQGSLPYSFFVEIIESILPLYPALKQFSSVLIMALVYQRQSSWAGGVS
mmetsp:Transcript_16074/g.46280  ORF Transcript_16074/g.46280 Transcript_16074/m.46280 type:complete len:93 (+) Transcript_16074:1538-1816(+)